MSGDDPIGVPAIGAGLNRLRVEVLSMDIECCVAPPAVGDVVSWPLMMFVDRFERERVAEPLRDRRRWHVERWTDATVLSDGAVHAFWATHGAPPPPPGSAEVEGVLLATLHYPPVPEGLASACGRVSRIWVLHHRYEVRGPEGRRVNMRIPESVTLREVEHAPRIFRRDSAGRSAEDGLLVELALTRSCDSDGASSSPDTSKG